MAKNTRGSWRRSVGWAAIVKKLSVGAVMTALMGGGVLAVHSPATAEPDSGAAIIGTDESQPVEADVDVSADLPGAVELPEDTEILDVDDLPGTDIAADVEPGELADEPIADDDLLGDLVGMLGDVESAFGAFGGASVTPFVDTDDLEEPDVIFEEDFEEQRASGAPISLNNYTGSEGMNYTASPYWLDAGYCNGFITSFNVNLDQNSINHTYCGRNLGWAPGDYWAVRAKAWALGVNNGDSDQAALANQALSTNTSGGKPPATGGPMFRTTEPINIDAAADAGTQGRFIAFSVDAANTNCDAATPANNPQMQFFYEQEGQQYSLPLGDNTYIDPCVTPGGEEFDAIHLFNVSDNARDPWITDWDSRWRDQKDWIGKGAVGTFYSGSFFLESSADIGLILDNYSAASSEGSGIGNPPADRPGYSAGTANGNDGAIDNIRILDVTPVMKKEFNPPVQSIGRESEMTITVVNRSDKGAKHGWAFTDTLDEGLQFTRGDYESTCEADIVVDPVNGKLQVTDGKLDYGEDFCQITTYVSSLEAGEYKNGRPNNNFSDVKGVDGPENADIKFVEGTLTWEKVNAAGDPLLGSVWTLTGPEPATDLVPEGGWHPVEITDCVADSDEDCTGADQDPAVGKFEITGLPSGTYELTEKTAPEGFIPASETWTVELEVPETLDTMSGQFNAEAQGRIVNKRGSLTWKKVDAGDQSPLAGSVWRLEATEGDFSVDIEDCTEASCAADEFKDQDQRPGFFYLKEIPTGEYTLSEITAPDGYQLIEESVWTGVIDKDNIDVKIGVIENEKLAPAEITVYKEVVDVAGNNPEPAANWSMSAQLKEAEGQAMTPETSQQTGANGEVSEPWVITFPKADSRAEVTMSENLASHPGFEFVSAVCEITSLDGAKRTVTFNEAEFVLDGDNGPAVGDSIDCVFTNKPTPGEVIWSKVDKSDPATLLAGSEWQLTGPLGSATAPEQSIEDCTAGDCSGMPDKDPKPGKFKLEGLAWGKYTLEETKAPVGYQITGDNNFEFEIGPGTASDGQLQWDLGAIENEQRDGPTLPLTGGIGRDVFTILGLVTLVLGAGAGAALQIRKRRMKNL